MKNIGITQSGRVIRIILETRNMISAWLRDLKFLFSKRTKLADIIFFPKFMCKFTTGSTFLPLYTKQDQNG